MKRNLLCILLVTVLFVCVLPMAASADSGARLGSSIYTDKGYVTVTWSGRSSDNYYLFTQCNDSVSGGKQPQELSGIGSFNSCELEGLLPGHSYQVYLVDSSFQVVDAKSYNIPYTGAFSDGKLKDTSVKVTIDLKKKTSGGSVSSISELKSSDIARDLRNQSAYYGFKYTMQMPKLAKTRSFHMILAVKAPNGMISTTDFGDVSFDSVSNGYQTLWANFTGNQIFSEEYDTFGTVPSGTYTVELYWDGMIVNRQTIRVR